tara:strand:- start:878 stop:1087 length:210 start_codon:yes stop_codon:yes gene_type:complete
MSTFREARIEKKRKRLAKLPASHFFARQIKRTLKKWGVDVEEAIAPVVEAVVEKPKPKKKKGVFSRTQK